MTSVTFTGSQHTDRSNARPGKHEPYDRREHQRETEAIINQAQPQVDKLVTSTTGPRFSSLA